MTVLAEVFRDGVSVAVVERKSGVRVVVEDSGPAADHYPFSQAADPCYLEREGERE